MPPRFAYWTIILDGTPTSFRTKEREDILPLYNQLKAKNPAALLKWFSGGRLWDSPEQAKDVRNVEKVRRFRDERSKETKEQREVEDREMAAFREKHGRPADGRDNPSTRIDGDRSLRASQRQPPQGEDPLRSRGASFGSPADRLAQDRSAPRDGRPSSDPLAEFRRQHGRPADGSDQRQPPRPLRPGVLGLGGPQARQRVAPREGRPPSDRRSKDWRPGGEHKDPRDKYKLPPGEARKRWKDRNLGPRVPKPFGSKPFGSKPGGDRPYGDGPRGPKPFGSKPGGDRPFGDRPRGPKPFGSKPFGSKPGGDRPFGDRPRGPKPFGSKPYGDRPQGDRPYGDRPRGPRPFGSKPFGSKPGGDRPYGDRPRGRNRSAQNRSAQTRWRPNPMAIVLAKPRVKTSAPKPFGSKPGGGKPFGSRPRGPGKPPGGPRRKG